MRNAAAAARVLGVFGVPKKHSTWSGVERDGASAGFAATGVRQGGVRRLWLGAAAPAQRSDRALPGPAGIGQAPKPVRPAAPVQPNGGYKRAFDLAVLCAALVLLAPAWLPAVALVAAAVRVLDGRPVLFRQRRLGRDGRPFDILKFRTMPVAAETGTGPVVAAANDARATPVGRVLRRWHLDELPQAVNVLRGEMSLVGPRPERPELVALCERRAPGFGRRLAVAPGIAGLAQARRGAAVTPAQKLRYDLLYIRAMGPWLDARLLAACALRALRGFAGVARGRGVALQRLGRPPVLSGFRSAARGMAAAARQACAEAAHVRGPRTAARWLAWLGRRLRWALLRSRHQDHALPPRGAGAALRCVRPLGARRQPSASPAAGPGFDPRRHNPVGWTGNVERRVLALGPPRLLPPGARARRACRSMGALRHAHHVEDVAAFHADAAARAALLARTAATGTPVQVLDRDPALAERLGAGLHALLAAGPPPADPDGREAASVRMRRLALSGHARRPGGWPTVSVLLATRRPARLAAALRAVARQDYPRVELVLALHGDGFAEVPAVPPGLPVRVVRVGAGRPLGEALQAAAAAASGELQAKMDDDDRYGPSHLTDLVLAREYSGAALVGKGPETVYLAGRDLTVRRGRWRAERFSHDIAGGALLISRADLARAGGWRPLPRGVDQALAKDVAAVGGAVYRTHGLEFVLVRHGGGHTWAAADARFLADADEVRHGWRPELAGLSGERWNGALTG